jgi:hypothetical protein
MPIPDALIAVISLSADNLPNVINTVINIAIGVANETIHAELYIKNFNTVAIDKPFPKNLSIFFKIKLDNNTKINMNKELRKGVNSSFRIYLFKILSK